MGSEDRNDMVFTGRYGTRVSLRVEPEKPIIHNDFEKVAALVRIVADIAKKIDDKTVGDPAKMDVLLGSPAGESYTPQSVMGKLVNELAAIYQVPIELQVPEESVDEKRAREDRGEAVFRVVLKNIPDDTNAIDFTVAVRRVLRSIQRKMEPPERQMSR